MDAADRTGNKYFDANHDTNCARADYIFRSNKISKIRDESIKSLNAMKKKISIGFYTIFALAIMLGAMAVWANMRIINDLERLYDITFEFRMHAYRMNIKALQVYIDTLNVFLTDNDAKKLRDQLDIIQENKLEAFREYTNLKEIENELDNFNYDFTKLDDLVRQWNSLGNRCIELAGNGYIEECTELLQTSGVLILKEIKAAVGEVTGQAAAQADDNYNRVVSNAYLYEIYGIVSIVLIAVLSIFVIRLSMKKAKTDESIILDSQKDLNAVLDELMTIDEELRQSIWQLETESCLLKELQERYINALDASNDAIWEYNLETKEFFFSEKWSEITTYSKDAMPEFLQNINRRDYQELEYLFHTKASEFQKEFRLTDISGLQRWILVKGKLRFLRDNGPYIFTGSVSDVTEKKSAEKYMEYLAYRDYLTGLMNRAAFIKKMETVINFSKKTRKQFCVLFLDLDEFKIINDTYGHTLGDELLVVVSKRLLGIANDTASGNKITVARFGGDEFLLLIEDIDSLEIILDYTDSIMAAIKKPIEIESSFVRITVSIGASIFPADGKDVTTLLQNVDSALFNSKRQGKSKLSFFDREMFSKMVRKAKIIDILYGALHENSLYMMYQPQWSMKKRTLNRLEALMRLSDKELGTISPAEFIPLAEETHLIIPMGYWLIRNVLEFGIRLEKRGVDIDAISLNISEVQLSDPNFFENVKNIFYELNYDPKKIHFEITEGMMLRNMQEKIQLFDKFRDFGIKIALDDFGTGYSSLNYLKAIPLDIIKIDKCFIDDIGVSVKNEALIDLIIRITEFFGAESVSEGVETIEQVNFLSDKGCDYLQGYYFSQPLHEDEVLAELEREDSRIMQGSALTYIKPFAD